MKETLIPMAQDDEPMNVAARDGDIDINDPLNVAARDGDIETLYRLLAREAKIIERFDQMWLCETPLHIAARAGQTHFAMEMMNLKPSLARKLNESGFSPMHLALQNKHCQTVRGFMEMDSNLISIKGRGGITPLHYVAETGQLELLSEFLSACPSSVEDLTIKCETALHIAVKNKQFYAFEVLFGWLQRVNQEEVLNWKDEDGNTVFHIATSTNQIEVVRLLRKIVHVNTKNFEDKTAMDIFQSKQDSPEHEMGRILRDAKAKTANELSGSTRTLADYLRKSLTLFERRNKMLGLSYFSTHRKGFNNRSDFQGSVLVVAILIATATYQAGLSPPGGYWQEDSKMSENYNDMTSDQHEAGQMTMDFHPALFFYTFNGIAFFSSMAVIMFSIIALPAWTTLCGSIVALGVSNLASFAYTFPETNRFEEDVASIMLVLAYPVVATGMVSLPLVAFVRHEFRRRRVDTFKGGIPGRLWG